MTARGAIVLLIIGVAIGLIGSLFMVMHWPRTGHILIASTVIEVIALTILAIKVARYPGFKEFLDH